MFLMKKLLFLFVCLFVATRGAARVCSDEEFTCANGQCVDDFARCDGTADCIDGSDETANECEENICPSYAFRCAYGACIPKDKVCDKKNDCHDNSDENQLRCLGTEDEVDKYFKRLQGSCEPYAMQCNGSRSGQTKCIGLDYICDGTYDCPDKSDETSELCSGLECPSYAFKCSYGACISKSLVCNHEADCVDGSDERPKYCLQMQEKWKAWKIEQECYSGEECYVNAHRTVVPVDGGDDNHPKAGPKLDEKVDNKETEWSVVQHGESPTENKYCTLSQTSRQLQAFNYITGGQYAREDKIPSKSLVMFRCPLKHILIGREHNACFNGVWQTELPQCEPLCSAREASRGISTLHTCTYDNKHVDCNQPARVGTVVRYMCAPEYHSDTSDCLKNITCTNNGKWSSIAPICSPICADINRSSPDHQPWVVTIYQSSRSGEYIRQCYGAVMSPKLVISVGSCFEEEDRLRYQIAEGKQLIDFNEFDGHRLRLHNVSELQAESLEDSIDRDYKIALLKVVDYFQFSRKLSPLCIHPDKSDALIKQLEARKGTQTGEIIKPIDDEVRIVYKHYPQSTEVDALDIGQFYTMISRKINSHKFIL